MFDVKERPQWCPGCGNFAILLSLKNALKKLGKKPEEVVVVSGIGCSGKLPHYINTYGFEALHGRPLPVAQAIKLANPKLTVIAHSGDGDGYGIGLQHFVHACRRNSDITYIVHNNGIYGLTTGQTSPTSMKGVKTKSTPHGNPEEPVHPLMLALVQGATFIARGYAGDVQHLTHLFEEAIKHKGFAIVDVIQPCVSFNKQHSYEFWGKRLYKLEEEKHDFTSFEKALEKMKEEYETNYEKVPIGIFYKKEEETFEERFPQLKEGGIINRERASIRKIMEELM